MNEQAIKGFFRLWAAQREFQDMKMKKWAQFFRLLTTMLKIETWTVQYIVILIFSAISNVISLFWRLNHWKSNYRGCSSVCDLHPTPTPLQYKRALKIDFSQNIHIPNISTQFARWLSWPCFVLFCPLLLKQGYAQVISTHLSLIPLLMNR